MGSEAFLGCKDLLTTEHFLLILHRYKFCYVMLYERCKVVIKKKQKVICYGLMVIGKS